MFTKPSKEFICQEVPYITTDISDSSGAGEVYKIHTMLIICYNTSILYYAEVSFESELQNGDLSSSHSSEDTSPHRHDSFTVIPLNPDASISASDFEKKWTNLPTA